MRRVFLLIITFISTFAFFYPPQANASTVNPSTVLRVDGERSRTIKVPDKIRVVIADNVGLLNLSIRGRYKVTTVETAELLKEGRTFFNIKIKPAKYGIDFGRDYFKIYAIQITPVRETAIYLGKRLYRGCLQILRTKEGYLRAINVVDLEDYLKGVLYHEISHRWPMEAIKAQAVVSRTFALYQAQEYKDSHYYLKADVSSQVYGGRYAERYRTNKAVEETKGKVLVYRGKLLPAFFHATCGGRTEDASRLWKVDLPPLKGIACPFCKNSPHFFWRCDVRLSDIERKLRTAGYKVSYISSIEIKKRDRSGRALELVLRGKTDTAKISVKEFRRLLGPALIKSTDFTVGIKGEIAHFEGRGWGHGVGMCQWGAFAMAKKGKTAEEILRYYYPGARVVTLEAKNH